MGACEGFSVQGFIRVVEASYSRSLVLELKPDSEVWDRLCGLCSPTPSSEPQQRKRRLNKHTHQLKGSILINPGQNRLQITVNDCGKQEQGWYSEATEVLEPELEDAAHEEHLESVLDLPPEQLNVKKSLQYKVDGKVYELKSPLPICKKKALKKTNGKTDEPAVTATPKKPAVAGNENIVAEINARIFEDASAVNQDERLALETTLEALQVTLMEKCLIPDVIICGPETTQFLQNMRKLAKVIGTKQPSFRCEQCHEQLTSYFPYVEHVFRHFGTRPYVCAVCKASFQTRAVMRHHLDMHGGKAPFQCEFCGKKFRNSCHMKQHRMRHTGEKPHQCPYCDKTFAHKNVLKMHVQSHTGDKPCCCDLCGKLFREPHRLACHLATHCRNEKSIECRNCGKKFKSTSGLETHASKRCKGRQPEPEPTLTTLQNAAYLTADRQEDQHEVAIVEAETLEDGTMILPANAYIVEPPNVGAVLVQFSIDTSVTDFQSSQIKSKSDSNVSDD